MTTFSGASVFVTGGSRGIGKAIALRFAALGAARVAIGYLRSDRAAEETAEELTALGAQPILIRGNISSDRVLEEVALLGALDVLVHNAATGVIRPALETEDKHWDWTMTANARALLALTRVVAPQMLPGSSIVGISSLGSQRVLENYSLVGTSKAALEALVRYLAVELAPLGIRVNGVSGGVVDTGALEHFPNKDEMLRFGRDNPAGQARAARGHRRRGRVPLLAGGRDDPRPDADRRRRLLAQGLMEPTDHNRRAFDDAHRTSENVLQVPGMPDRIRERLQGASGHRVLHLFSGTGRESVDLADLGALVTGVDDDEASIESARRRAPELPWVHADVHALPPELLLGRWDLVYLGYGSLRAAARRRAVRRRRRGGAPPGRRAAPPRRASGRGRPRRLRPLARRLLRRRSASASSSPRWSAPACSSAGSRSGPARTRTSPATSCWRRRSPALRNRQAAGRTRPWESQSAFC